MPILLQRYITQVIPPCYTAGYAMCVCVSFGACVYRSLGCTRINEGGKRRIEVNYLSGKSRDYIATHWLVVSGVVYFVADRTFM